MSVDLAKVAELWEAAMPDDWDQFGGSPSFLDVYGSVATEDGVVYDLAIAKRDPLIGQLIAYAEGQAAEISPSDFEDQDLWASYAMDETKRVANALIAFDFGYIER